MTLESFITSDRILDHMLILIMAICLIAAALIALPAVIATIATITPAIIAATIAAKPLLIAWTVITGTGLIVKGAW